MSSLVPYNVMADIEGCELDKQLAALAEYFSLAPDSVSDSDRQRVLIALVRGLESSGKPYPFSELLLRLGKDAIAPVSALLSRTQSPEVRTLAALILLNNGSSLGVPDLLSEIEHEGDYLVTASLALANAGISDHLPKIAEWLRQYSLPRDREFPSAKDDVAMSLLGVFQKLKSPIPEDIRQKFSDSHAPRFFRFE